MNSSEGWLADAVGNYTVDSKCTWLIEAPSSESSIRLHLKEFATECGWDHLYIFDGDSVFSDTVGVLSGMYLFTYDLLGTMGFYSGNFCLLSLGRGGLKCPKICLRTL